MCDTKAAVEEARLRVSTVLSLRASAGSTRSTTNARHPRIAPSPLWPPGSRLSVAVFQTATQFRAGAIRTIVWRRLFQTLDELVDDLLVVVLQGSDERVVAAIELTADSATLPLRRDRHVAAMVSD